MKDAYAAITLLKKTNERKKIRFEQEFESTTFALPMLFW